MKSRQFLLSVFTTLGVGIVMVMLIGVAVFVLGVEELLTLG